MNIHLTEQLHLKTKPAPTIHPRNSDILRTYTQLANRVVVGEIDTDSLGVRHNKQGIGYLVVLWLVSLLALLKNGLMALVLKVTIQHQTSLANILWDLGRSADHFSSLWVDRFSRFNHQAKYGAASWQALDLFYNFDETIKPQLTDTVEGKLTRFWIERMHNRQAVSIRLKTASHLIANAILRYRQEPVIRLVSIASGSAQAVIQGILLSGCPNVAVVLIDSNPDAIRSVQLLVEKAGLQHMFTFVNDTSRLLEMICDKYSPHIVEMMGFLDYRPRRKAIGLIERIYNCLLPGGTFLTCNIRRNPEKIFVDWVLLWPMIYRSEIGFSNLLIAGKFSPDDIQLYYDPFRIHGIAECFKHSA